MSGQGTLTSSDGTPKLLRWAPFGVLILFVIGFGVHAVFFDAARDPLSEATGQTAPVAEGREPDLPGEAAEAIPAPSDVGLTAAATMAARPTARTARAAEPVPPDRDRPESRSSGPAPADLRGAIETDVADFEPLGERRLVSTTIEGAVFVDGRSAGRGYRVVLKDLSKGGTIESVPTGARGTYTVDVDPGNRYMPVQVVAPDGRRLESDPATVPFSISNGERITLNIQAFDKKSAPVPPAQPSAPPRAEPVAAAEPAAVWGKIQHPVLDGPAVGHRLVLEAVPGGSRSYSAPSAEDGTYEIPLLPGRYKVVAVQGPEGALWWLADSAPFYLAPAQRQRFDAVEYRR